MPANASIHGAMVQTPPHGPAPSGWGSAQVLCVAILVVYVLLIGGACVALRSPAVVAHGNETTWDRALFTALNAATLTGFQQTMGLHEMSATGPAGPLLMLGLTFAGALLSLIVGGLAAVRILRMPHGIGHVAWAAFTWLLLATLAGAAALSGAGRGVFDAIFQSASAFANSGLWLSRAPSNLAGSTYLVLLPLAVLGGLGMPVLLELGDRIFGGPRLSRHGRVVFKLAGIVYVTGLIALLLAQAPAAAGGGWMAWRSTLASCTTASINARSAGLPFGSPASFTAPAQWLLIALMCIGAAPAGTAGGVKTTTLWQVCRGIADALRGRVAHRATGIAAVWLGVFVMVLFIGVLLLVGIEPQLPAERSVFLAASALGNVGLSHDPVSITGPGLLVLSALMLIGRLAPLAVLWWMAQTCAGSDVAVG